MTCACSRTSTAGSCGSALGRWRKAKSCAPCSASCARTTSTCCQTTARSRRGCACSRGRPRRSGTGSCLACCTSEASTVKPRAATCSFRPTRRSPQAGASWLRLAWSSATSRDWRWQTALVGALGHQVAIRPTSSWRWTRSRACPRGWAACGSACLCRAARRLPSTTTRSSMGGLWAGMPRPWFVAPECHPTCPSTLTRCLTRLRRVRATAWAWATSNRRWGCCGTRCLPGRPGRCASSAARGTARASRWAIASA
mmetsp:Transcript_6437/g.19011  ORF Transcript_6437/g.19011 Transcript_6437/m.19011 type:complete len:255 (+) Transcript_6437:808-1572(+)